MATTINNVKRTPAELHELFKGAESGHYTIIDGVWTELEVVVKCLSTDSYVALVHKGLNVGDPMAFGVEKGLTTKRY